MNSFRTTAITVLIPTLFLLFSAQASEKKKSVKRDIIYTEKMVAKMRAVNLVHYAPCHIRFTDSRYADLDDLTYLTSKHPIGMECYSSDDAMVNKGWAKFDRQKEKWVAYFSDDERDKKLHSKRTKVYQLKALNSQGYVVTVDDIIGDPKTRDREMYYCLVRPPKAVCGQGRARRLSEPKSDVLPFAMEILRSVEFIDD